MDVVRGLKRIKKDVYIEFLIKTKQYNKIDNLIKTGKYLGAGASRETISLSNFSVVKILRPVKKHSLQSQHELAFYLKNWKKYKKLMCKMKLHYYSPIYGLVLIMEKAEEIGNFIESYILRNVKNKNKAESITKKIEEFEKETQLADSSENPGNWGKTKYGRLVVIDCGISYDHDLADYCTYNNSNADDYGYGEYGCCGECDYCDYPCG